MDLSEGRFDFTLPKMGKIRNLLLAAYRSSGATDTPGMVVCRLCLSGPGRRGIVGVRTPREKLLLRFSSFLWRGTCLEPRYTMTIFFSHIFCISAPSSRCQALSLFQLSMHKEDDS